MRCLCYIGKFNFSARSAFGNRKFGVISYYQKRARDNVPDSMIPYSIVPYGCAALYAKQKFCFCTLTFRNKYEPNQKVQTGFFLEALTEFC